MNLADLITWPLLATTFTTLFVIMDPPGSIPIFLSLTRGMDNRQKALAARQATLTSLGVIVGFALLGNYILAGLQISMQALQLAGGVLLFLVAMELLMKAEPAGSADQGEANIAMVPLGTPLLAGPGAIVAVMVAVNQAASTIPSWVAVGAAVILMHLVVYLTLRFSVGLQRILGKNGVLVLTKIAGLLLAAIATQMVVEAIFQFITEYRLG